MMQLAELQSKYNVISMTSMKIYGVISSNTLESLDSGVGFLSLARNGNLSLARNG